MLEQDPFHVSPALSGTGLDDLIAVLKPHLPPFEAQLDSGSTDFNWHADVVAAKQLAVFRTRCSGDWRITPLADEKHFFVVFPLEGALRTTFDGKKEVMASPGTAQLCAPSWHPRLLRMCVSNSFASLALKIDGGIAARTLSASSGRSLDKLPFQPLIDLSSPLGQSLTWVSKSVASGMHGPQVLAGSPKALALLSEGILRLIFDHVLGEREASAAERDESATPRHIAAAIDFMEANLHQPLTVADIAAAAGVSVRSLQLRFRQVCDVSPIGYLRRIRLDAVRRELSLAENRLPVAEVALKWGFVHLGRFSSEYLAAYGVLPSETVKRSRRKQ